MYQLVSMKKIACLRRRLAIEADSAITTALTRLLEKETERSENERTPAGNNMPQRKSRPGGHRTAHFRNCRFATGSVAEFRRGL
jgi:hypothetical protein